MRTTLPGFLIITAALGFVAVFSLLSARFDYPEVLDQPPALVLPALIHGGASLRALWALYAVLPLLLVAVALLRHAPGRHGTTFFGVAAGLSMSLGLARWPTLQWSLGTSWLTADASTRAALEALSAAFNLTLGQLAGEFLGEVTLAAWLLGEARATRSAALGLGLRTLAVLLLLGSLRNVLPAVQPATEVTNVLLPAVLGWFGVHLLRGRGASPQLMPEAAHGQPTSH